jgi:hypothetical protein
LVQVGRAHCGRFETSLSFVEIFLNELEKLDMCSKYTPFEASAVGLRGEALSLLDQWVTGQDIFVHTNLLLTSSIFGLLLRRAFEFFLHKNSIGVERASRAFISSKNGVKIFTNDEDPSKRKFRPL